MADLSTTLNSQIAALVNPLTPGSSTELIYSGIDDVGGNYTRNANIWTGVIDLTCIPASIKGTPTQGVVGGGVGVLVSQQYAVAAAHYAPSIGGTVNYVSTTSVIHPATVANVQQISGTDLLVVKYTAPVDVSITPAKILPSNWAIYPSAFQAAVWVNQDRKIFVGVGNSLSFVNDADVHTFISSINSGWNGDVRQFDSGCPVGILLNGTFVPILDIYTGPGGYLFGPLIGNYQSAIQGAILAMGGSASDFPATANLSSFTPVNGTGSSMAGGIVTCGTVGNPGASATITLAISQLNSLGSGTLVLNGNNIIPGVTVDLSGLSGSWTGPLVIMAQAGFSETGALDADSKHPVITGILNLGDSNTGNVVPTSVTLKGIRFGSSTTTGRVTLIAANISGPMDLIVDSCMFWDRGAHSSANVSLVSVTTQDNRSATIQNCGIIGAGAITGTATLNAMTVTCTINNSGNAFLYQNTIYAQTALVGGIRLAYGSGATLTITRSQNRVIGPAQCFTGSTITGVLVIAGTETGNVSTDTTAPGSNVSLSAISANQFPNIATTLVPGAAAMGNANQTTSPVPLDMAGNARPSSIGTVDSGALQLPITTASSTALAGIMSVMRGDIHNDPFYNPKNRLQKKLAEAR